MGTLSQQEQAFVNLMDALSTYMQQEAELESLLRRGRLGLKQAQYSVGQLLGVALCPKDMQASVRVMVTGQGGAQPPHACSALKQEAAGTLCQAGGDGPVPGSSSGGAAVIAGRRSSSSTTSSSDGGIDGGAGLEVEACDKAESTFEDILARADAAVARVKLEQGDSSTATSRQAGDGQTGGGKSSGGRTGPCVSYEQQDGSTATSRQAGDGQMGYGKPGGASTGSASRDPASRDPATDLCQGTSCREGTTSDGELLSLVGKGHHHHHHYQQQQQQSGDPRHNQQYPQHDQSSACSSSRLRLQQDFPQRLGYLAGEEHSQPLLPLSFRLILDWDQKQASGRGLAATGGSPAPPGDAVGTQAHTSKPSDPLVRPSPAWRPLGGAMPNQGRGAKCVRQSDPLRWFHGGLVPPALRAAQADFRAALHACVQLASAKQDLSRAAQSWQDLQERCTEMQVSAS